MPTSIHIPTALMKALDRRAKLLRVSRNSLIVRAIERELGEGERGWPADFFAKLEQNGAAVADVVDETMAVVRARRGSKEPIGL